jgi:hypothetical protein
VTQSCLATPPHRMFCIRLDEPNWCQLAVSRDQPWKRIEACGIIFLDVVTIFITSMSSSHSDSAIVRRNSIPTVILTETFNIQFPFTNHYAKEGAQRIKMWRANSWFNASTGEVSKQEGKESSDVRPGQYLVIAGNNRGSKSHTHQTQPTETFLRASRIDGSTWQEPRGSSGRRGFRVRGRPVKLGS